MSLRKKIAENYIKIGLIGGSVLGAGVSYTALEHKYDWDIDRTDKAEQTVQDFQEAFSSLSDLSKQNDALEERLTDAVFERDTVAQTTVGPEYQNNLVELKEYSTKYAQMILKNKDINEPDFADLATSFNELGLAKYSDFTIDADDAHYFEECQLRHITSLADNHAFESMEACLTKDRTVGFVMAPVLGGFIGLLSGLIATIAFEAADLHIDWRNIPDKKAKNPNSKAERLKRRLGMAKKPPTN